MLTINRKKLLILSAGGILTLAIIAGIVFFAMRGDPEGLVLDANATMGVLPGVDMEQRQKELQDLLDESMIAFSINTSPVFKTGKAEGNLMLENPANNAKLLVVEIYADETSELLFRSNAIQPGAYIQDAKLDKVLEKGEYPATAYFKAYREEDQSYIGQSGAAITITVAN